MTEQISVIAEQEASADSSCQLVIGPYRCGKTTRLLGELLD